MDPFGGFTRKFGQLDLNSSGPFDLEVDLTGPFDLGSPAEPSTQLTDLADLSLLDIFELLNIQDISSISLMNKRFNRLAKPIIKAKKKRLVVYFGVSTELLNSTRMAPSSSRQERVRSFDPIMIDDNRLLSEMGARRLRPVETLMFYTNNYYRLSPTFSMNLLPNLKFLYANDFDLNNYLVNASDVGLCLPNIKHLFLGNCPFDILCKTFPNVVHVELMQMGFTQYPARFFQTAFKPKWRSMIITQEKLDSNSGSHAFVQFMISNCKRLNHLQIGIDEISKIAHLQDILRGLVQVNELKLFFHGSTKGLRSVLSQHLERLSDPNFKLTINFVTLQPNLEALEPIYELNKDHQQGPIYSDAAMELAKQDTRLNFNRREFYDSFHRVLLDDDDCRELVHFEECSKHLKRIDQLNVWKDRLDVDLGRFLRTMPDTIVILMLRVLDAPPQWILDALPTLFPRASLVSLNNFGNSAPDLKFLFKFPFLDELQLKDLTFSFANRDDLCKLIEDGRFFAALIVEYLRKRSDTYKQLIRPQLMAAFEHKKRTNGSINFQARF